MVIQKENRLPPRVGTWYVPDLQYIRSVSVVVWHQLHYGTAKHIHPRVSEGFDDRLSMEAEGVDRKSGLQNHVPEFQGLSPLNPIPP
jgi:hypothetical protein